ncbi:MAG: HesA/MoeB/ThiF family protein [Lentisphaerota bacterium]
MKLNQQDMERYARQIALPEIGVAGQKKLLGARVLVVGVGGLGSPAAYYLAAAGVGTLGLMDHDRVDISNLQRQILHGAKDVGRLKTESAAEKLRLQNPAVKLVLHAEKLTVKNGAGMVKQYDFVVDACDTLESKSVMAGCCHAARTAYSYAAISAYCAQVMTVIPGQTACYRCAFPSPVTAPKGPVQGPLGVVPGIAGTLQAAEAIKHLLSLGRPLVNEMIVFDVTDMTFQRLRVAQNKDCPLCGKRAKKV